MPDLVGNATIDAFMVANTQALARTAIGALGSADNAATATKLAATKTINGVAFDGSANITVTAQGSTLSDAVPINRGGTGVVALGTGLQVLRTNAGATTTEWATIAGTGDVTAAVAFGTDGLPIVSDGTGKGVKAVSTIATATVTSLTVGNLIPPVTNAISASAIDWSLSLTHSKTLSANTTFTFSNAINGKTIIVAVTNTASNWTVTWPTVSWVAGTAPTQTVGAHTDIYTFVQVGSTIYGSAVQNF
jgi:hypothetical protein